MFEKKYHYYLVRFNNGNASWYRSESSQYRAGMNVIVPVSNNGIWGIGLIAEAKSFAAGSVPCPLIKTKGIVDKAGPLSQHKVNAHNSEIQKSKKPPLDISVAGVKTRKGIVTYITCEQERKMMRQSASKRRDKTVIIENYPPVKFDEIPKEAQKRFKQQAFERVNDFMELMEDLDAYN